MRTFEEQCDEVYRTASRAAAAVLIVKGKVADDLGAHGLQLVANRAGRPVITDRDSERHSGSYFRPEAA